MANATKLTVIIDAPESVSVVVPAPVLEEEIPVAPAVATPVVKVIGHANESRLRHPASTICCKIAVSPTLKPTTTQISSNNKFVCFENVFQ
jgi:hypothetical protein